MLDDGLEELGLFPIGPGPGIGGGFPGGAGVPDLFDLLPVHDLELLLAVRQGDGDVSADELTAGSPQLGGGMLKVGLQAEAVKELVVLVHSDGVHAQDGAHIDGPVKQPLVGRHGYDLAFERDQPAPILYPGLQILLSAPQERQEQGFLGAL